MSNLINRGQSYYSLRDGHNVWCKHNCLEYKLKSVPYGKDFVIVVDNEDESKEIKLLNSEVSFYIKYTPRKAKIETCKMLKVLKHASNWIQCIFIGIENDCIIVKSCKNICPSFRDCKEGYLPDKKEIKYFTKTLKFEVCNETLNKMSLLPINTILEIRADNENNVIFIGKFKGGEMVYCTGDKPEWFSDYEEIYGDYELTNVLFIQ